MDKSLETTLENKWHVSGGIVLYKFTLGFFELILGLGLLFANSSFMYWYKDLAGKELLEDPHDLLILLSQQVIPIVMANRHYLVFNLVLLGMVKIIGAIGLLYKKEWGVDLLVGLTILMLPFQLFRLYRHFSVLETVYFGVGLFIALYLINFKPKKYAHSLWEKFLQRKNVRI